MKTLQQHIEEKLIINQQVDEKLLINKNYKSEQHFIYEVFDEPEIIKIFDADWEELDYYKDKVRINNKYVEINEDGYTYEEYDPGKYHIEIIGIDNVKTCQYMFFECEQLITVPEFDTSKVKNMNYMFQSCSNLKNVALLNTTNVTEMSEMFTECNKLSSKTKKQWSKIYNFFTDDKL